MRTLCLVGLLALTIGCRAVPPHHAAAIHAEHLAPPADVPRELSKVALPTYSIEPPDILRIRLLHVVPRTSYALRTDDIISISVPEPQTNPNPRIKGAYAVYPGGLVDLGLPYGEIAVGGLTVEEARDKIAKYLLENHLQEAAVSVSLLEITGKQQIADEYAVAPDGTITLGSYGQVSVVGLSLAEAKQAIESHLQQFLEEPEVSVDVYTYNSKYYYVITEGAGLGDVVLRFPVTGNETVLDAIAQVEGLNQVSSKRIWVARPAPDCSQALILPVDWSDVAGMGVAATNYQLMPGDRIFVAEDPLVALDTRLAKLFAPLERTFGFTLLATGTATRLSGKVLRGGGNPGGSGGSGF